MPCLKRYTVIDVKNILSYSEGTGPAQERHPLITNEGWRDRTLGTGGEGGIPQASAFLTDKLNTLIFVITQSLNSPKGQAALTATCVFYQGESAVTAEKLQRASIVLDSNNGGRHPFKIVTAFPSKDDPFLGC